MSANWTKLSALFSLLVGGATLIVAAAAAWYARKAAQEAKRSADEAVSTAATAEDSLRHAKRQSLLANRPWLVVSVEVRELYIVGGQRETHILVELHNVGRTPALHARILSAIGQMPPRPSDPTDDLIARIDPTDERFRDAGHHIVLPNERLRVPVRTAEVYPVAGPYCELQLRVEYEFAEDGADASTARYVISDRRSDGAGNARLSPPQVEIARLPENTR